MTILLALDRADLLRRYEPALRLLAARGHRIHLVCGDPHAIDRLARVPDVRPAPVPEPDTGTWPAFARAARLSAAARRPGARLLARAARAAPPDRHVLGSLREIAPDLVLALSPFAPDSRPRDYLAAARSLEIPTAVCVDGWDEPTAGGPAGARPGRLLVWSEAQRERAVVAGVRAAAIVVTGAQGLDAPREGEASREELCRVLGLEPANPFVLFAGSPLGDAAAEPFLVERWLVRLRQAPDPAVAGVGVLVVPHPRKERRYLSFDGSQLGAVAVWPPSGELAGGASPSDAVAASAGVVSLDTTVLPDAVAAGTPFLTFAGPDAERLREAWAAPLVPEAAELVSLAAGLDEHVRDLARLLRGELEPGPDPGRDGRLGLTAGPDPPAALADAIEAAARVRVERVRPARADRLLRAATWPLAVRAARRERRAAEPAAAPGWLPAARPTIRAWVRLLVLGAYAAEAGRRAGRLVRR